jgi:hypothetical protein
MQAFLLCSLRFSAQLQQESQRRLALKQEHERAFSLQWVLLTADKRGFSAGKLAVLSGTVYVVPHDSDLQWICESAKMMYWDR